MAEKAPEAFRTISEVASDLDLPRMEKRIPRTILSVAETERVLQVPDIHTPVGLRDRAMLETFYSTGIRRRELMHLKLYDVDRERATRGRKDRPGDGKGSGHLSPRTR